MHKLPHLPDTLIGKIVQVCVNKSEQMYATILVTSIPFQPNLQGYYIAGDLIPPDTELVNLLIVYTYRLIDVKDLPLLIGEKYTTPLLEQLIKEGDTV